MCFVTALVPASKFSSSSEPESPSDNIHPPLMLLLLYLIWVVVWDKWLLFCKGIASTVGHNK